MVPVVIRPSSACRAPTHMMPAVPTEVTRPTVTVNQTPASVERW